MGTPDVLPKLPRGVRWKIKKIVHYRADYSIELQERSWGFWGFWSMTADRYLSNLRDETIAEKADECYRAYQQLLIRREREKKRLGAYPPKKWRP